MTYNQVKGSAEYIMAQTRIRPKIAIILGTGLNPLTADIENATRIPYKNIPSPERHREQKPRGNPYRGQP